jgi:peptidoglycan hydrolase CwlO-like protein
MIDIHIPASFEYDTATASLLATTLKNLHGLDEMEEWNKKAMAEVEVMHSILSAIEEKQQKVTGFLSQEKQDHETISFFFKIFGGRKEHKQWLVEQSRLAREKAHIETLIDQFESVVDFLPGSLDEIKALIEECKQQKSELLTEKKAVNTQMSSIREEARQQTANTNYGNYGKGDRRRIRLNKELALRPQESQKSAIGRLITELDQTINWLERFQ